MECQASSSDANKYVVAPVTLPLPPGAGLDSGVRRRYDLYPSRLQLHLARVRRVRLLLRTRSVPRDEGLLTSIASLVPAEIIFRLVFSAPERRRERNLRRGAILQQHDTFVGPRLRRRLGQRHGGAPVSRPGIG